MAQRDDLLNRSLDVGKDVTQRTQEALQERFDDLVREVTRNTEHLIEAIERDIRAQLHSLGELATKLDIQRIEAKLEELTGLRAPGRPARRTKRAAKKATAKKSAAKKATTKKAAAKKSAAKKATAKKSAAKKATAKKSAAKRATAKKAAKKASATKRSAPRAG